MTHLALVLGLNFGGSHLQYLLQKAYAAICISNNFEFHDNLLCGPGIDGVGIVRAASGLVEKGWMPVCLS